MAADQIALHEVLGGDDQAILIARDWGAAGAWGAAGKEPGRWRRCIILDIPPFAIFGIMAQPSPRCVRRTRHYRCRMPRKAECADRSR